MITSIKKARKMLQEIKEICNFIYHNSYCQSCPFGIYGADKNRCFFDFDQEDQRLSSPVSNPMPKNWETDLIWCRMTKGD